MIRPGLVREHIRGAPCPSRRPSGRELDARPSQILENSHHVIMAAAAPITIGLPVFNGEPYLEAAIESILAQTFVDFTLFVSDNASTDATEEIVRSFAKRDQRVQYDRSPQNRGAAWNFNRAFEACESPFFKWAASDDLLAPTCVERCYELLLGAPPEVVLAYPQTRLVGPGGEPIRDLDDRLNVREATPHARLRHVVAKVVWGNLIFGLMVSNALRRTRGHGSYPSADWVLLAELALLGQFWMVPEPLFLRREHEAMSRKANRTTLEIARFMDPESKSRGGERRRIFVEHFGAIKHMPLSPTERSLCYSTFVVTWTRRQVAARDRISDLIHRFD